MTEEVEKQVLSAARWKNAKEAIRFVCFLLLAVALAFWIVDTVLVNQSRKAALRESRETGKGREQRIETCASYCSEISWSVVCDETFDALRGRLAEDENGNDICLCYVRDVNFHPWTLQGESPWASE